MDFAARNIFCRLSEFYMGLNSANKPWAYLTSNAYFGGLMCNGAYRRVGLSVVGLSVSGLIGEWAYRRVGLSASGLIGEWAEINVNKMVA